MFGLEPLAFGLRESVPLRKISILKQLVEDSLFSPLDGLEQFGAIMSQNCLAVRQDRCRVSEVSAAPLRSAPGEDQKNNRKEAQISVEPALCFLAQV